MPGDTKIKRTSDGRGWVDIDNPVHFHRARRLARDARRARLAGTAPQVTSQPATLPDAVTSITRPSIGPTGLRSRLLDRFTNQGVSSSEAEFVLSNFGYNASASYGHMREAGASHTEAVLVISLDSPSISLAYGLARAYGFDHAYALREAQDGDD